MPEYEQHVQRVISEAWRRREFGSYYDVALSWFNIFGMTGDIRALRLGRMAATAHWDYDMQHVGPKRGIRTVDDPRHIYTEGLLAAYVFTGDRLALEMAREVADGILEHLPGWEGYIQGYNERSGAWPLISLIAAYEATLDERYLRGARWVVDRILAWQHPTRGGWIRSYEDPEECPYGDQGGSPFMTALLMEGLYKYFRVSGDARVPPALSRAADWLVNETWWPSRGKPDLKTFLYIQCRAGGSTQAGYGDTWDLNPMIAAGLLAADRLHANPRVRDVGMEALRVGVARHSPPPAGKQFAQFFRSSGMALALAQNVAGPGVPAPPGGAVSPVTTIPEEIVGPWFRVNGTVTMRTSSRPVLLDGRFEAEEWSAGATLAPFVLPGGEGIAKEQSLVRVMADREALYLAFQAEQARTPGPPAASGNRRLWDEDSVEIFLAPGGPSGRYFQFIVGVDGARYQSMGRNSGWKAPWEAATGRYPNGWSAEIRIPFSSLEAKPEGMWGLNVCRNQAGGGEKSCWVAPMGLYHNPHRFGRLHFGEDGISLTGNSVVNSGDADQRLSVLLQHLDVEGRTIRSHTEDVSVPRRGSVKLPGLAESEEVSAIQVVVREAADGKILASETWRRRVLPRLEVALVPSRYATAGEPVVGRVWIRERGKLDLSMGFGLSGAAGRPAFRWRGEGPASFNFLFVPRTGEIGPGNLSVELTRSGVLGQGTRLAIPLVVNEGF